MNRRIGVLAAGLLLVTAAALAGCGTKDSGTEADGSAVAGGAEALYKQKCISCHGDQLEGRIGPSTNLTHIGGKLSREQIVAQITNGGGGMPGFKSSLKENEIGTLADWLAAKK